jgi:predicted enzyme related to lactoylglutathione lyase
MALVRGFEFTSIPVQDSARAKAFYRDVLGLRLTYEAGPDWNEFELDGVTIALWRPEAYGQDFVVLKHASLALRVDDAEAAAEQLRAQGVEIDGEVFDSGVCKMAFIRDTEGNQIILHHRYVSQEDEQL